MTRSELVRTLRRMLAMNVQVSMAYRGNFAFYMLGAIFGPIVAALVWRAAMANGASLPVERSYLITYFVLLSLISMLTSAWLSGFIVDEIRSGNLTKWLVRPGSFIYELVASNLAEKAMKLLALAPLVAIFAFVFRHDLAVSVSWWRWLAILLAIVLSGILGFSLDVAEGSLGFWLEGMGGLITARYMVTAMLTGQIIPLALFPEWAQGFMKVQPFRYFLSFPLELTVGAMPGREVAWGIALQVTYAVCFVLLARWLWRRGLGSYSAAGA